MKTDVFYAKSSESGVIFRVWLQPRSARNEIRGMKGDALKVRVTSPPTEGRANKALCDFLSQKFGVPKSQVEIVKGLTSRTKTIRIDGVTLDDVRQKVEIYLR